jgi:hypothetical protein
MAKVCEMGDRGGIKMDYKWLLAFEEGATLNKGSATYSTCEEAKHGSQ